MYGGVTQYSIKPVDNIAAHLMKNNLVFTVYSLQERIWYLKGFERSKIEIQQAVQLNFVTSVSQVA